MFPVLLKIGPLMIQSYGVFLVLGFLAGLFLVWKRGREEHFDEEALVSGAFWLLALVLVGARLAYILFNFSDFSFDLWQWLNFRHQPGLEAAGGLIGGAVALVYWAKRQTWPIFKISDVVVIAAVLGQMLISVGNLLAGNHYGGETNWPWGIKLPTELVKRQPLPLYELILLILVFWFLLKLEKEYRSYEWYKNKRGDVNPGLVTGAWLVLIGLIKFILGLFLTKAKSAWFGLNQTQAVGLVLIILGLGLVYRLSPWWPEVNSKHRLNQPKKKTIGFKRVKRGLDLVKK